LRAEEGGGPAHLQRRLLARAFPPGPGCRAGAAVTCTSMTERLDLADPYLTRFEAEVTGERRLGDRPAVILSRTAFYPEGGGQPADHGTLGAARVVDVQEVEGEVLHAVEGPVPSGRVAGAVDWARRFDHMQQHHGQHLLSAAFEAALGAATVSFHLGAETCTIDLATSADRLGPGALAQVEWAANATVWRDLPVVSRDLAPEELARLSLRKEPTRGSRVVVVEGVDASPCGGTHPRRTGEVGAIAVLRAQKWGAAARVEFACGGRVLALVRAGQDRLVRAAAALRCAPAEVPEAAARAVDDGAAGRKERERLAVALAGFEAARLAAAEGVVRAELTPPAGDAAAFLRAVAQALAARGRTALLGARGVEMAVLCFARPKGAGPDLGALLREAAGLLGGKGGGSPDLAQGGGPGVERLGEALALAASRLA
jgi:alanyl-tRNA synthetase